MTSNCLIRAATAEDMPFLWSMLLEAAYPLPDRVRPTMDVFKTDEFNGRYLSEWGRAGDVALIAEVAGEQVGAAWFRLFTKEQHAYGFLSDSIPELAIAVRADHRGDGIGSALLGALILEATRQGFSALSLSVAAPNPALRLYERFGFEKLALDDGGSWTMRRHLRR